MMKESGLGTCCLLIKTEVKCTWSSVILSVEKKEERTVVNLRIDQGEAEDRPGDNI